MSFLNPFQLNKTSSQSNQSSPSSSSSPAAAATATARSQPFPQNEQKGKSKLNRARPTPLSLSNQISKMELLQIDDSTILEGITTNMSNIQDLLQKYKDSSKPRDNNNPKPQHLLTNILTILEDIRCRIDLIIHQHSSSRHLHSDIVSPLSPKMRLSATAEENENLRRELVASLNARKSLERMFSGVGREKEMIAAELARKVQELSCLEELVNDLRADNFMMCEKLEEMKEMKEKNNMAKTMLREAKEENEKVREEVEVVLERMKMVRERREKEVEEMKEMENVLEKLANVRLPSCSN